MANGTVPEKCVVDTACIGELGLDGSLRPVPRHRPHGGRSALSRVVVPAACTADARLVGQHEVRGATSGWSWPPP